VQDPGHKFDTLNLGFILKRLLASIAGNPPFLLDGATFLVDQEGQFFLSLLRDALL